MLVGRGNERCLHLQSGWNNTQYVAMAWVVSHGLVLNCHVKEEFGKPTASRHMLSGCGDSDSFPRKTTDWVQPLSSVGESLTSRG